MLIIENRLKDPTATPLPCANACRGEKCQFNTPHGTGLHKGGVSWSSRAGSAQKGLHRRASEPPGAPGAEGPLLLPERGVVSLLLPAHAVWKHDFQTPSEGRFRRMQLSAYMLGNSMVTNPCSSGIFCRQVHAWEQPFRL